MCNAIEGYKRDSASSDRFANSDMSYFISPATFWRPEKILPSAWIQHTPFAFWLIDKLRPQCLVELGTHHGHAYLSFCQTVQSLNLQTRCYAVDTWQGDEHAGRYGDDVHQALKAYHDPRYSGFSRLVRSNFEDASKHFNDGSIDLLHIDGRHFYQDVKEDFECWRSKLSSSAIVLFHDTNVRERQFGVWQLWSELSREFPSFEFLHGHGLGVLGYGEKLPSELGKFFALAAKDQASIRNVYHRLGQNIEEVYNASNAAAAALRASAVGSRELAKPAVPSQRSALNLAAHTLAKEPTTDRLHLHMAALEPELLDVRTYLPMRQLAQFPGLSLSSSEKKITLPQLAVDLPKVAVLQRLAIDDLPKWKSDMVRLIEKGWLLVTEIDDHPAMVARVHKKELSDSMWDPLRFVHAVQTSTERLGDELRQYNQEMAIFPNCAFSMGPLNKRIKPGKLRVFFGALNREEFSSKIGAALAPFARENPGVEFVVIHDRAFFEALGEATKVFSKALPYDQYLMALASCDVSLMPLEGGVGEEFKSDLKFVEASSRGVASIASPLVYRESIVHGQNGIIADTVEQWVVALQRLYTDPTLRVRLATAAYEYVDEKRRFHWQAPQRLDWYRSLYNRRDELNRKLLERLSA